LVGVRILDKNSSYLGRYAVSGNLHLGVKLHEKIYASGHISCPGFKPVANIFSSHLKQRLVEIKYSMTPMQTYPNPFADPIQE
jgi:hypothetical protein